MVKNEYFQTNTLILYWNMEIVPIWGIMYYNCIVVPV